MKSVNNLGTALALTLLSSCPAAYATNGYFSHGLGVKNKALAGAGTAYPQEAMATSVNPASAVILGETFEAGISLFSPRRAYEASNSLANGLGGAFTIDPGQVDSNSEYFPIPYVAKTWDYGEESAFGLSL